MVDANEFYRQVTRAITSSLRIDSALHRLLLYLQTVLPVDEILLSLLKQGEGTARLIAHATKESGATPDKVVSVPQEALDAIAKRLNRPPSPQTIVVPRLESDAVGRTLAAALGKRDWSSLNEVLVMEGEQVAQVVLLAQGTDRFTPEHAQLMEQVNDPLCIAVANALHYQELTRIKELLEDDNRLLRDEMLHLAGDEVVGAQFGLRGVMELVRKVAPLSSSVLLLGETGVGKDVIANAIHRLSTRHAAPFVKANCGAIPTTLVDSELFGHERGAFTGAVAKRRGLFERAHLGTLFLDEIAELPMEVQSRLLRVLQGGEFGLVGGSSPVKVDVRIIAATNRNLREMVEQGKFREDLWYRLNVFPIAIPPLRERLDDLPSLVHHLLQRKSDEQRLATVPPLAPGALQQLLAYPWPGNIRELQNVIERALILSPTGPLGFADLLPRVAASAPATGAAQGVGIREVSLAEVERQHIQRVLDQAGGRVNGKGGAAELLAMEPNTLRHRMRKLGIAFGRREKATRKSVS